MIKTVKEEKYLKGPIFIITFETDPWPLHM